MGEKTAGVGHFLIPTAPAAGTVVISGSLANLFTQSYVTLQTSAGALAASYLTAVTLHVTSSTTPPTYATVQIAVGASGSESIADQQVVPINAGVTGGFGVTGQIPIIPPVPVAASTRIAAKTADSVGNFSWQAILTAINQSNVVDDGVAMSANEIQIAGVAASSTTLSVTTKAVGQGTVTTGATANSVPTSALTIGGSAATGVVASQFVGRTILFNGDTTTAGLRGAVASINASTASNTPTLTVSALPATPASGDTFSII